jgi:hypothetical protein
MNSLEYLIAKFYLSHVTTIPMFILDIEEQLRDFGGLIWLSYQLS